VNRRSLSIAAAGCLALTGCIPPKHHPAPPASQVTAPPAWREQAEPAGTIDRSWWQTFHDPLLTQLIERALQRNTDLLTAAARVEESRQNVILARSSLLPSLNGSFGASNSRALGTTGFSTSTAIQPEVLLDWQIDLFGRLRQLRNAAQFRYAGTAAERDGVALCVAAQTAQAYFGLLSLDAQLLITEETIKSRSEALRLAKDQAELGYTSQFELTQAQSEYESVAQQRPEIERQIRVQETALRVLSGDLPEIPVSRSAILTVAVPPVPSMLPSELLHRRPDIVQAELQVAAADATLASRRAEFLPQVAISASVGSLLVDSLDYNPGTIWSMGSSILTPFYAGGQLTAQYNTTAAQRDQAAFAYRSAVLQAFADVERALTGVRRYDEQIAIIRDRRSILQRSVTLSQDRYQGGYSPYLEQLDAQRNLYTTELEAVTVRQSQLANIVLLYQAFGGGWNMTGLPALPKTP
jgi:multidrug efflux system outer membrane protein